MNKNIVILGLLFTGIFSGCNDNSFLQENPDTFYTTDNVFSTSEQIDQVIVSCYSDIRKMITMEGVPFVYKGNNGTDMFDVPTIRRGNRFNDYGILNPSHSFFYNNYSMWYSIIANANLALYAAELPQISWSNSENKAYSIAQAKFFRAFCYRNLGELYGGVPIVTQITTSPRYDFVRESRLDTYQFAIDELESILNDLPQTTNVPGRIVRAAAQHNLCQLYIDKGVVLEESGDKSEAEEAYSMAIKYGNDIIDGGIYSLMKERFGSRMNDNPVFYYANNVIDQTLSHQYPEIEGNVFWDLFQDGNQNYQDGNKEAIWVIQIDYDAYNKEDKQSVLQYSRNYSPVFRDPLSAHIAGMMEDVGGRGVAQVMPTQYTRDLIYEGKWADDDRNSTAVFRRLFLGNVKDSEYFGKIIPWDVIYKVGESKEKTDVAYTLCYPISCKVSTDRYVGLEDGQNRSNLFRDEYMIRLSETILLRAEAKMRIGDNAGAASDINLLRERAKCSYLVTPNDVNLDLILDERARELVYEEFRWNTLLRMGGTVASDRIKKYSYWDDPRTSMNSAINLWPIPQIVIDTNKDVVMTQNPGW